jgi:DNA-binding NarL/FixJ family response regulator
MIRVLVVARSDLVRAGLEAMISPGSEIIVAGQASGLEEMLSAAAADVILMASDSVLDQLASDDTEPMPPVVLLSEVPQPDFIRLGGRGLLPSDVSSATIVAALRSAAQGLVVIHPTLMDSAVSEPARRVSLSVGSPLTPREAEVLGMLAEGAANKEIAFRLGISEHTVKFHISSIFSKLNASTRTEAVTIGARLGLVLL